MIAVHKTVPILWFLLLVPEFQTEVRKEELDFSLDTFLGIYRTMVAGGGAMVTVIQCTRAWLASGGLLLATG